jgi:hypothetical protein
MKNETIKTYTEITVEEAGEMLRDNEWKPVEGMAFRDFSDRVWNTRPFEGMDVRACIAHHFTAGGQIWGYCAKVTELDPNQSPDGCPELEPWMAYVGKGATNDSITGCDGEFTSLYFHVGGKWNPRIYFNMPSETYAIDVRTAWAQEHFPEHVRIRNYQEAPDAFEEWLKRRGIPAKGMKWPEILREAYELGQDNPNPTK